MEKPQATAAPTLPNTAAGQAHARLRADIVLGVLHAGLRLRINELAARYRCGAIPIREALNRLVGENLVVYSEQRGFAVAPLSLEDFADLTRARSMIAEIAIREALRKGDTHWEERVLVAHHRLSKVPRYLHMHPPLPNPDYDRVHREFHSALLSGCQSMRMVELADELFDHAERYRNVSRKVTVAPREDEHEQILQAVLKRNADEAVRLLKLHVERTYNIIADADQSAQSEMLPDLQTNQSS